MRKNLTAAVVEGLKAADAQADYWDAKRPGFGMRVSQAGAKTWIVMYRQGGRKHRLVLGRYPVVSLAEARRLAAGYGGDVARGSNPAQERAEAKQEPTFGEFAEIYLERHAAPNKKAQSVNEDRKKLASQDLAGWRDRKLASIGKRDVIAVLDRVVERGAPVAANRLRALLSRLFNFAIARDLIVVNPASRLPREPERARERKLDDDELRHLWAGLEGQPGKIAAAFRLLLLTACRRSEVLGMRWSEVDLETGWLNLPAGRTKNGRPHRVPLVGSAVAQLAALPRVGEFVFPGGKAGQGLANVKKPLARLVRDAELEDFHVHDLRRTVATRLAELGVERTTLKKILNHSEAGDITSVYDRHSYDAEKRAALVKWERRLRAIVAGESNLVRLAV